MCFLWVSCSALWGFPPRLAWEMVLKPCTIPLCHWCIFSVGLLTFILGCSNGDFLFFSCMKSQSAFYWWLLVAYKIVFTLTCPLWLSIKKALLLSSVWLINYPIMKCGVRSKNYALSGKKLSKFCISDAESHHRQSSCWYCGLSCNKMSGVRSVCASVMHNLTCSKTCLLTEAAGDVNLGIDQSCTCHNCLNASSKNQKW